MSAFFITMIAAVSQDGFLADNDGNGDFSSPEDKQMLRSFLRGEECDCFICGRKTGDQYKDRLDYKPLFILSEHMKKSAEGVLYISNLFDLLFKVEVMGLTKPALLGGAMTYHEFLRENIVDKIILTREENIRFGAGLKLNLDKYLGNFEKTDTRRIGPGTEVVTYLKKAHSPVS